MRKLYPFYTKLPGEHRTIPVHNPFYTKEISRAPAAPWKGTKNINPGVLIYKED